MRQEKYIITVIVFFFWKKNYISNFYILCYRTYITFEMLKIASCRNPFKNISNRLTAYVEKSTRICPNFSHRNFSIQLSSYPTAL